MGAASKLPLFNCSSNLSESPLSALNAGHRKNIPIRFVHGIHDLPHNKGTGSEPKRLQVGLMHRPQLINHLVAHPDYFSREDQQSGAVLESAR